MAHYEMLRDYHFSEDVDDIRGAPIYDANGGELAKVQDVIFDHESGDIRYLVAEAGHKRRVLIPSDHLFRSVVDERAFDTDLTPEAAAKLPPFDEKMLESERAWQKQHEEQRQHWREREEKREEQLERQADEKWHMGVVQHQHGSTHNITPEEEPEPGWSPPAGEPIITGADLTPHRIAGKFPGDRGPMVVPGSPNADEITLQPAGIAAHARESAFGSWEASPRFTDFQEHLRRHAPELRQRCPVCCRSVPRVA